MPKNCANIKSFNFSLLWKWKEDQVGKGGLNHRKESGKIGRIRQFRMPDSNVFGEEVDDQNKIPTEK